MTPTTVSHLSTAVMQRAVELGLQARALGKVAGGPGLPESAWSALLGAAGEALRNVQRHASADAVNISMRSRKGGVVVTITDKGAGISESAERGFGTSESIVRRMEQAGGSATIDSVPGLGTTVTLAWHPTRQRDLLIERHRLVLGHYATERILPLMGAIMVVAQAYLALRYSPRDERLMPSLVLATLLALAVCFMCWRLPRAALSPAVIVAWTFGTCCAIGYGLLIAGLGSLADFSSWCVGFSQLPMAVLASVLTMRFLLVVIVAPTLTVSIAIMLDPQVDLGLGFGALIAVALPGLSFALMGEVIARGARHGELERDRLSTAQAASARVSFEIEAQGRYLTHAVREVGPVLSAISVSDDLIDADTRNWASLAMAEARDDLYVPGLFTGDRRRRVRQFRRAGGVVRVLEGVDERAYAPLHAVLDALLPVVPAGSALTALIEPSRPQVLRITAAPGVSAATLTGLRRLYPSVALVSDEFVTEVEVEWTLEAGLALAGPTQSES